MAPPRDDEKNGSPEWEPPRPPDWQPPAPPPPPDWQPPAPPPPPRAGEQPVRESQPLYIPDAAPDHPPRPPGQPGQGRVPRKATAALVLGILGLIVCPLVCSVLAVVFGHQARSEIDADPALGGRGMATAGFVLGIIGLGFFLLIFVVAVGGA